MKINTRNSIRITLLLTLVIGMTLFSSRLQADTGTCGGVSVTLPFTDVPSSSVFFCVIAEAYFSALANGTDATHFSPADSVRREQLTATVTRTMDQSLKRGSRRAALKRFWTPTSADSLRLTTVGTSPRFVESDGADLWVGNSGPGTVSRVRASDGKLLETWTGATGAFGVLAVKGLIFVTGQTIPGRLYQIDPTQPVGAVTMVTSALGGSPRGIAYDGARVWTANEGASVSIVRLNPVTVSTVTAGFTKLIGILYDGANMWATDFGAGKLFKLDKNGAIIQSVTVGDSPRYPVFDGTNIWVPNFLANTVTVIRASTGVVLATLAGNGLNGPSSAAFDGERILVTNFSGGSVSLWKAADLSPLGSVSTASSTAPYGACSDGLNFWITLEGTNKLARF
jgi:hypothetical protein